MMSWRAPQPEIDALLAARHGDPFALLGPHAAPGGVVLRAFIPGAQALDALHGGGATTLPRRDAEGVFEALIPGAALPFAYRLRARRGEDVWEFRRPLRLRPHPRPLDDHLLVEGTHARLYDRLGAHPCTHGGVAGGALRRLGRPARCASRWSATSTSGTAAATPCPSASIPACGRSSCPPRGRRALQVRDPRRDGVLCPLEGGPGRFAAELAPRPPPPSSRAPPPPAWQDAAWMRGAVATDGAARRCPSTRSMPVPGRRQSGRPGLWTGTSFAMRCPLCRRISRFTPCRADAGQRASARRLLGLPAARLFA